LFWRGAVRPGPVAGGLFAFIAYEYFGILGFGYHVHHRASSQGYGSNVGLAPMEACRREFSKAHTCLKLQRCSFCVLMKLAWQ